MTSGEETGREDVFPLETKSSEKPKVDLPPENQNQEQSENAPAQRPPAGPISTVTFGPPGDTDSSLIPPMRPEAESAFQSLPYQDFQFHGEGGMGIVYRAEDTRIGRPVAVKVSKRPQSGVEEQFYREARITGRLEHPGIVPIYDVGQDADGNPYYAMRFIDQPNFGDRIREFHQADWPTKSAERRAALRQLVTELLTVSKTIAYAHHRGVLHLDIKPSNIVVSRYGETLVLDWGLAEPYQRDAKSRTEQDEHSVMSTKRSSSSVGGTPSYSSPEQAAGRPELVDVRTDVFLLGGTLYHVLTGRPPYEKSSLDRNLRAEIEPPRSLAKGIDPVLEAICLQAMQADRDRRYPSALAFADDLQRWLDEEPVSAYRESVWQRTQRWIGAHRRGISVAIAVLSIVLASSVVGLGVSARKNQELQDVNQKLTRTVTAEQAARQLADANALQARQAERQQRQTAERERTAKDQALRGRYVRTIAAADAAWQRGNIAEAETLLRDLIPKNDEPDLRGFEWRYLWRLVRGKSLRWFAGHVLPVRAVAIRPDGQTVLSAGEDGTIFRWNAETGEPIETTALHESLESGIGVLLKADENSGAIRIVRTYPFGAASEIDPPLPPGTEVVGVVGPDGQTVEFSNLPLGNALEHLKGTAGSRVEVEFRRPGDSKPERHLLKRRPLPADLNWRKTVYHFSPDQQRLATLTDGREADELRLWDAATGRLLWKDALDPVGEWMYHPSFSPDGKLLTVGGMGTLPVWSAETGQRKGVLSQDGVSYYHFATFAANGREILTNGPDDAVVRWDMETGETVSSPIEAHCTPWAVAVSPDEREFAVAGTQETVCLLFGQEQKQPHAVLRGHAQWISDMAFSPNSELLATASTDGTVRLWHTRYGKEVRVLKGHRAAVNRIAFSPDGRWLISASKDHRLIRWDLDVFSEYNRWEPLGDGKRHWVAPLSSGMQLAIGSDPNSKLAQATPASLALWNAKTGETRWLQKQLPLGTHVNFTLDSRALVLTDLFDGNLRQSLWNLETRQITPVDLPTFASRTAYSGFLHPKEPWLVMAVGQARQDVATERGEFESAALKPTGGEIAVYDTRTGDKVRTLLRTAEALPQPVGSLDGGESFVTVDYVGGLQYARRVQVRDFSDPDRILREWPTLPGRLLAMVMSLDGKLIVTAVEQTKADQPEIIIQIHDPETGTLRSEFRGPDNELSHLTISSDHRWLSACLSDRQRILVWDLEGLLQGKDDPKQPLSIERKGQPVHAQFSPDGTVLVTAWWRDADAAAHSDENAVPNPTTAQGQLLTFRLPDGKFAGEFPVPNDFGLPAELSISPDGRWLAGSEYLTGNVRLWDFENRKEVVPARVWNPTDSPSHDGNIRSVAVSPDNRLLATGGADGTVILWDLRTERMVRRFPAHDQAVSRLAFSDNGQTLRSATGTWSRHDGGAKPCEIRTWKLDGTLQNETKLLDGQAGWHFAAFPRKGLEYVTASWSNYTSNAHRSIVVRSLETHGQRAVLGPSDSEMGEIWCLAISADGTLAATASDDYRISEEDGSTKEIITRIRLWDVPRRQLLSTWRVGTAPPPSENKFTITGMAFSPDGKTLATFGFWGDIQFWHVATGERMLSLSLSDQEPWRVVYDLKFAADGSSLAISDRDGNVMLYLAE